MSLSADLARVSRRFRRKDTFVGSTIDSQREYTLLPSGRRPSGWVKMEREGALEEAGDSADYSLGHWEVHGLPFSYGRSALHDAFVTNAHVISADNGLSSRERTTTATGVSHRLLYATNERVRCPHCVRRSADYDGELRDGAHGRFVFVFLSLC